MRRIGSEKDVVEKGTSWVGSKPPSPSLDATVQALVSFAIYETVPGHHEIRIAIAVHIAHRALRSLQRA